MRLNRLDLNLLIALDMLLTEQSVTRAAQRVALSQSAMSGVLARLREHFEDELLIQVGRKMVLTEFGASLVAPIREIMTQIRDVAEMRAGFDPEISDRHFTIVASDYVIHVLMVDIVRHVTEAAPNVVVSFELLQGSNDATNRERLESGAIDVLITPETYAFDGQPCSELFREDYVCVAWSENPLARQELTLERYLAQRHVVRVNVNAQMPSYDEMHLRSLGLRRDVAATAPSFTLLPQLVIGTTFLATVHSRIARYYAQFLPIAILNAPIEFPDIIEVQQWPKMRDRDPGVAWLRRTIEMVARRMSGLDTGDEKTGPARSSGRAPAHAGAISGGNELH